MMNLIGTTLSHYQILEEIGRGGMGAVYKAYDPNLQRVVAIKVLAQHLTWDQNAVDRFHREAKTIAALSHPNIVDVHNVGEQNGIHYLIMDYVEGKPLSSLVNRQGALSPERAAWILDQIASALDYAHRQGLIHRDVKPGNILVSPDWHVTLTDFGIARMVEGTRLTITGLQLGTPHYMSPEQAEGREIDARTDVYALGVVLYEMLTGHVPFRADTPLAVLHQQIHTPPPSPRSMVSSLSREIEQVVLRALAKSPTARYPSAGTLAKAFRAALEGRASISPGRSAVTSRWKGRPWIYVAASLMFIAFIVGLILATQDRTSSVAGLTATLTATSPSALVTMPMTTPLRTDAKTIALGHTRAGVTPSETATHTHTFTPTPTRPRPTATRTGTHTPKATPTETPSPTATRAPQQIPVSPDNAGSIQLLRTLKGHTLDVLGVAFSPDNQTIASASDDKTIRLWRVSDGKALRTLSRHTDSVYSVAFNSDGTGLVSGSRDKTVRLWRVNDGSLLYTLTGHQEKAWCVAYSPRDTHVASGSGDKTVRVWSTSNGRLVYTLQGHTKPIYGLAFSPDGSVLASGSADNTIRLWQVNNGQLLHTLTGHGDNVRALAFSPDGTILASASVDRTIRLWSTNSRQTLQKLTGHGDAVLGVAFSPDGQVLASASSDKTVRLWRMSDGKLLTTLTGHGSRVSGVAFSPDGKFVVSSSDDRTLRLWGVLGY